MSWKTHIFPSVIQLSQVDSLGHMNNVAYFQLFEDARWDMIIAHNYGADVIKSTQQGPVILAIETQFKKEVLLGDKVFVESLTQSYEGKILKLLQELKSEDGEVHCSALYTIGLFDMQARRLIPPTPEWLHACGYIDP